MINAIQPPTKAEQNNIKAIIGNSYNRLYSQFSSSELTEVGNYKIQKQIGEGSFGKVYLATHRPTKQKVVLKTGDKSDPNVVREVFYHRQFDYPYITKLYEVIVTETKVWMALEYCPGKELYDHLLSKSRLPTLECAELFAQITGAVHYAHTLNCVHRDLKLENVLLDKNGNAKLTDFGFTRESMTKTVLETVCGTTVYMAPEMIQHKPYDGFKVDIWSLGVILYTLLCGCLPFDEDDDLLTKQKIINDTPVIDERITIPEAQNLIQQLLSKDPTERPNTSAILLHPFLQPYGTLILEQTNKIILKQKQGGSQFSSRLERRLIKKMKRIGYDTQAIRQSVIKKKCDSLSGLWFLLAEKEKKIDDKNRPRRSRSLLSVRKVFDDSTQDLLTGDDGLLTTSLEVTRVGSIGKILNKQAERVTSLAPMGVKKSIDFSTRSLNLTLTNTNQSQDNNTKNQESVTFSKEQVRRVQSGTNASTQNEQSPKKTNIFKKMSKFFKEKKYFSNLNNEESASSTNTMRRSLETSLGASSHNKESVSPEKGNSINEDENRNEKFDSTDKRKPIKQSEKATMVLLPEDRHKLTITEPNVTRLKSSSVTSRQTSTDNDDSESMDNSRSGSAEIKKRNLVPTARPFSGLSEISNDTYNSDYSTDGNTSSYRVNDPPLSQIMKTNSGGTSQYSGNSEKLTNGTGRRYIRRNQSLISNASSASEKSSRTDSFYDITTASPPAFIDNRSKNNFGLKESILPRFGAHHSWGPKRSYASNRVGSLGRRAQKRNYLKNNSSRTTQSIIKEEDSSDNDETDVSYHSYRYNNNKSPLNAFRSGGTPEYGEDKLISSSPLQTFGNVEHTPPKSATDSPEAFNGIYAPVVSNRIPSKNIVEDEELISAADLEDNFSDD